MSGSGSVPVSVEAEGRSYDGCAIQRLREQCCVTTAIKERYGLKPAFDYLVSEKLLNFARTAEREPELARQLPRSISEVRRIFQADEICFHLARVEREQEAQELVLHDGEIFDEDEVFPEGSGANRLRSHIRGLQ